MLYFPKSLKEAYGACFPTHSEQDHLMALRGVLIVWSKDDISPHAHEELSRAITEVTELIKKEYGEPSKLTNGTHPLQEHYRNIVAENLGWLYAIRCLVASGR